MHRPPMKRLPVALTALVFVALANAIPALGADTLTPAVVNLGTMSAGSSTTVNKVFHLDALPANADIVFAIDTTGSMGTAIAQAKADATNIVNQVQLQIPGARFALVDFRDYQRPPGQPTGSFSTNPIDYPYKLDLPLTSSALAFQTAVNLLATGDGGDGPEAYNRAFYEAVNDPLLVYNPNAVKFLIVLGDNIGHDPTQASTFSACPNTVGPDPGRNNLIGEPIANDDIYTSAAISGLAAANDKLLMISYGSFTSCYAQLVAPTGGIAVSSGGSGTLANVIVAAIKAAAAHIGEAHLAVVGPCSMTISFNPASYTNQTAPTSLGFIESITVPTTPPGAYSCFVQGYADGVARGNSEEIDVVVVAGAPAKVVLSPMTATNVVGAKHCVTATVTDAFGNPVDHTTVVFSVPTSPATHASPASGSAITDTSGKAEFCFTASLPGTDAIDAAVDSNSNGTYDATDTPQAPPASKVWTVPSSTSFCEVKITYGGWIFANNNDRANFGGNAQVDNSGNPKGQEEYQDQGPVQPMNVHSTKVTATTCDDARQHATIFGEATIDGSGMFVFRIDVSDLGQSGTNDTYGILLSNGYDSGQHTLEGGNVQIH